MTLPDFAPFWAITKHSDVAEIERNPDVFTNAPMPVLAPLSNGSAMGETPVKTLIQMDGDEHKTHRNIVNDWFKPGNVKKLQARVDELARQSVDRMAEMGGECDFVNDIALHFPLQVILSILGLPEDDYARMLKLTQELFGAEDPDIARLGEDQSMLNVILDFVNYFTALAGDRRRVPDVRPRVGDRQRRDRRLPAARHGHARALHHHRHGRSRHDVERGLGWPARAPRARRPARVAAQRARADRPPARRADPLRLPRQALHAHVPGAVHHQGRHARAR